MNTDPLLCPKCEAGSHIAESRPMLAGLRRRRRSCVACGYRWSTVEAVVPDDMTTRELAEKVKQTLAASVAIP